MPGSASSSTGSVKAQKFTFYSSVKNERYINNVDDLSRGEGHNPFGNVSSVKPPTNEKTSGPLAGDEAMFAFGLYTELQSEDKRRKRHFRVLVQLQPERAL